MDNFIIVVLGIVVLIAGILFKILVADIKEIKADAWEIKNNRNHISKIEENQIKRKIANNRKLTAALIENLDKKYEPIVTWWSGETGEYQIKDLTDDEKTVKKLRQQADELERESNVTEV